MWTPTIQNDLAENKDRYEIAEHTPICAWKPWKLLCKVLRRRNIRLIPSYWLGHDWHLGSWHWIEKSEPVKMRRDSGSYQWQILWLSLVIRRSWPKQQQNTDLGGVELKTPFRVQVSKRSSPVEVKPTIGTTKNQLCRLTNWGSGISAKSKSARDIRMKIRCEKKLQTVNHVLPVATNVVPVNDKCHNALVWI